MEIESADMSHQILDEIDEERSIINIPNNGDDAGQNITLEIKWDDVGLSKGSTKNINDFQIDDNVEEKEEDVQKYYISDENSVFEINSSMDEQQISDKSNADTDVNADAILDSDFNTDATEISLRKRRASVISLSSEGEDFYGFDETEELTNNEKDLLKHLHKKTKTESYSEEEKKKENEKIEIVSTAVNEDEKNIKKRSRSLRGKETVSSNGALNQSSKTVKTDKIAVEKYSSDGKSGASPNDIYRKPFDMGWKREVVYRSNPNDSNKDKGDVYYITPTKKRLRTKSEVMQHLTPGLSIQNFSFVRQLLGYDGEIVRTSLKQNRSSTDPVLTNKKVESENNLGKRIPKPKAPKGASPPPQGWTAAKAVKSTSTVSTPRSTAQSKNTDDSETKSKLTSKAGKQTKKNVQADSPVTTSNDSASRKKVISTRSTLQIESQQSVSNNLSNESFAAHFFGNVSFGYDVLLQTFQYLKVQELLRAACVCRMWNIAANHTSLWKTVRMKNSQIYDWNGLSEMLRRNQTKHLDLRKMLIWRTNTDEMWSHFSENISKVISLEGIDLCKCPAKVVENLFLTNPNLKIINAIFIDDESLNLENLFHLKYLEELRLKSVSKCALGSDLTSLMFLKNLKHLSLTSFGQLGTKDISVIGELICLESLELGDCTEFDSDLENVLPKLTKLDRLRLEKAQEPYCIIGILDAISKHPNLSQLELVNCDIKSGFDEKLAMCKNLKKLLLIPMYVSQSATTNNIVLKSLLKLSNTLRVLKWVVTLELLRVTALYVIQCNEKPKDDKSFEESIPVLKPVPDIGDINEKQQKNMPIDPQVQIMPLVKVEQILASGLPNTKFEIAKVPYHLTWRQTLSEKGQNPS